MATQIEAGTAGAGGHSIRGDGDAPDPAEFVATLVAALEPVAGRRNLAARPAPGVLGGNLSRREAEVLGLLAVGRSTRQSAAALCLSPRTVQCHVANVYLKIGAHCRAEAAAYALRHRLA